MSKDGYKGEKNKIIALLSHSPPEVEIDETGIAGIILTQYLDNTFDGAQPKTQFFFIYNAEDADIVHIRLIVMRHLLALDPTLSTMADKFCMMYGIHMERYKRSYPCPMHLREMEHRLGRRLAWTEDWLIQHNESLRQTLPIREHYLDDHLEDYVTLLKHAIQIELVEDRYEY